MQVAKSHHFLLVLSGQFSIRSSGVIWAREALWLLQIALCQMSRLCGGQSEPCWAVASAEALSTVSSVLTPL